MGAVISLRIERRERLYPDLGRPDVVGILRVKVGVALNGGGVGTLDPTWPIPALEHLRWTVLVIGHSVPGAGLVTNVVSSAPVPRTVKPAWQEFRGQRPAAVILDELG